MANIYDLTRRVALAVKMAPEFIIEETIFDAVQDLCINAEVWQETVDVDVSPNDNELMVSAPSGAIVARTMWVNLNGRQLRGLSQAEYLDANKTQTLGTPSSYYQERADLMLVYPYPAKSEEGKARIVCALRAGSTNFPDRLMALYRETIINGAIFRVLASPSDFGNFQLANAYEQKWYAGLNAAKGRATRHSDNRVIETVYGGY